MTRPNEQHQFDLLYMPHNLFKGNTNKYILTGIYVASKYKVTRSLQTKKSSEVAFVLKAIYKKGGVFKYPKAFQIDNGSEFKNEVKRLLEKHNVDIQRATTKYKKTHTAFVEGLNKELEKLLFKLMDAQELHDHVSTIWVKYLDKTMNKMNNTGSSMIGMKPKDAIKLDVVPLDKTYPKENVLSEDGYIGTFINLVNNMETKKDKQQTSFGAKIRIDKTELYKAQVIVPCTISRTDLIELLYVKN